MKYWDACSVVPLVYQETTSATLRALFQNDAENVSLATVRVEVECTFARLLHEVRIDVARTVVLRRDLQTLFAEFGLVPPEDLVVNAAIRLARAHPIELRAGDALHLAAWQIVSGGDPSAIEFITLDRRLRAAALAEGATVLP